MKISRTSYEIGGFSMGEVFAVKGGMSEDVLYGDLLQIDQVTGIWSKAADPIVGMPGIAKDNYATGEQGLVFVAGKISEAGLTERLSTQQYFQLISNGIYPYRLAVV